MSIPCDVLNSNFYYKNLFSNYKYLFSKKITCSKIYLNNTIINMYTTNK